MNKENLVRARSIDLHPCSWRRPADIWHLGARIPFRLDLPGAHVGLQSLIKIMRTNAGHDNGHEQEQDGQNSKTGQRFTGGLVVLEAGGVGGVHAHELEEEVAKGDEVDDDDEDHARDGLAADPEGGEEEENEGDDERRGGEGLFGFGGIFDHDEELHGEGEEEEEVELEESDVNLGKN